MSPNGPEETNIFKVECRIFQTFRVVYIYFQWIFRWSIATGNSRKSSYGGEVGFQFVLDADPTLIQHEKMLPLCPQCQ